MKAVNDTNMICCCTGYYGRDVKAANARMIAAAPDLLAALQDLIPMFAEWHSQFPQHVGAKEAPALQIARAAIANATGSAT